MPHRISLYLVALFATVTLASMLFPIVCVFLAGMLCSYPLSRRREERFVEDEAIQVGANLGSGVYLKMDLFYVPVVVVFMCVVAECE